MLASCLDFGDVALCGLRRRLGGCDIALEMYSRTLSVAVSMARNRWSSVVNRSRSPFDNMSASTLFASMYG